MVLGLPVLAVLIGLLILLSFGIGRALKWIWPNAPNWRIAVAASLPGPAILGLWALHILQGVNSREAQNQCGVDACGFAGVLGIAALVSSAIALSLSLWFLMKQTRKSK